MLFCNAGTEKADMYRNGYLKRNGELLSSDLTFMAYDTEEVIIQNEKMVKILLLQVLLYAGIWVIYIQQKEECLDNQNVV